MAFRRLGQHGLIGARLVLGTMMFGARTDEAKSRQIIVPIHNPDGKLVACRKPKKVETHFLV